MVMGLVGRKCGMTRVFNDDGVSVPVTVIEVEPNRITQIKTVSSDGYCAVQVTTGAQKASRISKPMIGHYAKAKVSPGRGVWEFRVDNIDEERFTLGTDLLASDIFSEGQYVDVTSTSKGKGFAGVIKRHNFAMQDATHGNSLSHRAHGSTGQNQSPGKVFKGKKMAGQMGNVRCTVQNQQVVRVDAERNIVLVKGTVPGAPGVNVVIRSAIKKEETK